MARINIIDGNNQFFLNMSRALNAQDLARRCFELHQGYDIVYWIFDGLDSRKPRRDLYPAYKETTARIKNNRQNDPRRYELLNNFKREDLPKRGGCIKLEIPFFEADDIIRKLITILSDGINHITISSNDADLLNLTTFKNVIQPQAKLPATCETAADIPFYKALVGDSSDNIKGLKGFGEKAWENLDSLDFEIIKQLLLSGEDYHDGLNFIDQKLKDKLKKSWSEVKLAYQLVDFIDVPDSKIKEYLVVLPLQKSRITPTGNLTMSSI